MKYGFLLPTKYQWKKLLASDIKILQQLKKIRKKKKKNKNKNKNRKKRNKNKMKKIKRKKNKKIRKIKNKNRQLINLLNQLKIKLHVLFASKLWLFQLLFNLVIIDFVEDVSLNLSIVKRIPAYSVGNKLQLLSEMLPLLALLTIILRLILKKKEIQKKKNNRKRKAFLDLIQLIFKKKYMERLPEKQHLNHNLHLEEVEGEDLLELLQI